MYHLEPELSGESINHHEPELSWESINHLEPELSWESINHLEPELSWESINHLEPEQRGESREDRGESTSCMESTRWGGVGRCGEGTVSSVRAAGLELELVGESAAGCDLNFPHGSLVHRVLHLHLAQRLCSLDHLPANNTNSNSQGAGSVGGVTCQQHQQQHLMYPQQIVLIL